MKKILEAGIIERIQFDSLKEMYCYIGKLRSREIDHKCISHTEHADGKVDLTIIKQYNTSPLFKYTEPRDRGIWYRDNDEQKQWD